MGKTKKEKGITLVALIVTIIVLLILAVVAIRAVAGDGILKYAKDATTAHDLAELKEKIQLAINEWIIVKHTANIDKETGFNSFLEEKIGEIVVSGPDENGNYYYNDQEGYQIIVNPERAENNIDRVPTVEKLQSDYEFYYYSSLGAAVTEVNNNTIGDNADSDKENAVAGIYIDANGNNVVLLKDSVEDNYINTTTDMTINLGGHIFTANNVLAINSTSNNILIDGRLNGSTISISNDGIQARGVQVRSGNFTINGGTYIGETKNISNSTYFVNLGQMKILNANFIVSNPDGEIRFCTVNAGTSSNIINSNIIITGKNTPGIYTKGTLDISNTKIDVTTTNGNSYCLYTVERYNYGF